MVNTANTVIDNSPEDTNTDQLGLPGVVQRWVPLPVLLLLLGGCYNGVGWETSLFGGSIQTMVNDVRTDVCAREIRTSEINPVDGTEYVGYEYYVDKNSVNQCTPHAPVVMQQVPARNNGLVLVPHSYSGGPILNCAKWPRNLSGGGGDFYYTRCDDGGFLRPGWPGNSDDPFYRPYP